MPGVSQWECSLSRTYLGQVVNLRPIVNRPVEGRIPASPWFQVGLIRASGGRLTAGRRMPSCPTCGERHG
jgi:hypothetical protein